MDYGTRGKDFAVDDIVQAEMDRFSDAQILIREEIAQIEKGNVDINNNVLRLFREIQGAPHPPSLLMGDTWTKPYSREYAAFASSWLCGAKFWPTIGRVDNVYRDRNLVCTLLSVSQMADEQAAMATTYTDVSCASPKINV